MIALEVHKSGLCNCFHLFNCWLFCAGKYQEENGKGRAHGNGGGWRSCSCDWRYRWTWLRARQKVVVIILFVISNKKKKLMQCIFEALLLSFKTVDINSIYWNLSRFSNLLALTNREEVNRPRRDLNNGEHKKMLIKKFPQRFSL